MNLPPHPTTLEELFIYVMVVVVLILGGLVGHLVRNIVKNQEQLGQTIGNHFQHDMEALSNIGASLASIRESIVLIRDLLIEDLKAATAQRTAYSRRVGTRPTKEDTR